MTQEPAKKRGLGMGLSAVLGNDGPDPPGRAPAQTVPIEFLAASPLQPRRRFAEPELASLAESLNTYGVLQPLLVRPAPGPTPGYEIIAGERRWRAAQLAGLGEVPAVVREIPDEAAIAMALIENIQRENLNPLEEARALDRLIREFGLTHAEAAEAVGRSRASVSNLLRLQDLSDKVKPMLEDRQMEMGHARALLSIQNPIQQLDAATQLDPRRGIAVPSTKGSLA